MENALFKVSVYLLACICKNPLLPPFGGKSGFFRETNEYLIRIKGKVTSA